MRHSAETVGDLDQIEEEVVQLLGNASPMPPEPFAALIEWIADRCEDAFEDGYMERRNEEGDRGKLADAARKVIPALDPDDPIQGWVMGELQKALQP